MDTVARYRAIIEQVLLEYSRIPASIGDVQLETVFDRDGDHYLLIQVGWGRQKRIYGTLAHIDLIGNKVWVQHAGTEEGLAARLRESGVASDHIVLGYRIPEVRPQTGYAVA